TRLFAGETAMSLSQRCQYAVRALWELARRYGQGPVPVAEIAEAQAIPPRFLELILAQLKQPGWVASHRGIRGGYALTVPPEELTLGEVIRFMEGPLAPVRCVAARGEDNCPLRGQCAFADVWQRAEQAVADVYDSTSFKDLLDAESPAPAGSQADYCI
ncbi:MAG: RrF2 family transcriptional regulator, partial [Planctomycetota bacterium]